MEGTYTLLREIGRGGMGRVYLAHDPRLDRHVALKLLPGDLRTDPGRNARFLAEARSAAALDHPNVATIYEIGETRDGGLFIAMAYYGEETLRERIARGPLPLADALGIAQQIADGLGAAHQRGIVHRDIKPENILITANGVAKIVDFGIAKIGGDDRTRTGDALGTPHYMAPEQVRGDAVDARADLWALGVVLHEMLASERPWSGESVAAILHGVLDKPSGPLPDDVPTDVRRLIDRLLARNLDKRYASAAEVRDALRRIQPGRAGAATVADARRSRRWRAMQRRSPRRSPASSGVSARWRASMRCSSTSASSRSPGRAGWGRRASRSTRPPPRRDAFRAACTSSRSSP